MVERKSAEQLLDEARLARDLAPPAAQDGPGARLAISAAQAQGQGTSGELEAFGAIPVQEQAYLLRVGGYRDHEIAHHLTLTYKTKVTLKQVKEWVADVIRNRKLEQQTSLTDVFQIELDRVDRLIKAVWLQAEAGDGPSIDRIVKLMQRKAQMLGLDAPEVRATLNLNDSELDFSKLTLDELKLFRDLRMKAQPTRAEKTVGEFIEGEKG